MAPNRSATQDRSPSIGYATNDRNPGNPLQLGGAGHYRCGLPQQALADRGYDARIGHAVSIKDGPIGLIPAEDSLLPTITERCARMWVPDIIVLQRYMIANADQEIVNARRAGQIVVNDLDDLMWNIPAANQAFRATHPKVHPDNNIQHYRKTLAASSLVTCSTPYLAEQCRRFVHDAPVVVVRNAIDLGTFHTHEHQEPPRLGWTGVLTYRANDVEVAGHALLYFVGDSYDKQFVHVGSQGEGQPRIWDAGCGLTEDQIAEHPWVPVLDWPDQLDKIDVGIVPLSSHNFNRAKSAIKGMEYAAAGIPFVASATDEYTWLYSAHGIGRLAYKPKHWIAHLRALADPDMRAAEAREQREKMRVLDIRNRWQTWLDAYGQAT